MSQLRGRLAAVARLCWLAEHVGKLFEQSVSIGNVACLLTLQSPEKHFSAGRIVATSRQRSDHLALMGDGEGFRRLEEAVPGRRGPSCSLAARIHARAVFLPVESI